jgi:hypothetical protein
MKQNKKLTLLYFELCSPTDGGERGSEPIFSGLYAYHIPTNTWKLVMDDSTELRSRIGHSMLFHPVCT